MAFLEWWVLFGIPALLLGMGLAALLWARWEERAERREQTPGE